MSVWEINTEIYNNYNKIIIVKNTKICTDKETTLTSTFIIKTIKKEAFMRKYTEIYTNQETITLIEKNRRRALINFKKKTHSSNKKALIKKQKTHNIKEDT